MNEQKHLSWYFFIRESDLDMCLWYNLFCSHVSCSPVFAALSWRFCHWQNGCWSEGERELLSFCFLQFHFVVLKEEVHLFLGLLNLFLILKINNWILFSLALILKCSKLKSAKFCWKEQVLSPLEGRLTSQHTVSSKTGPAYQVVVNIASEQLPTYSPTKQL